MRRGDVLGLAAVAMLAAPGCATGGTHHPGGECPGAGWQPPSASEIWAPDAGLGTVVTIEPPLVIRGVVGVDPMPNPLFDNGAIDIHPDDAGALSWSTRGPVGELSGDMSKIECHEVPFADGNVDLSHEGLNPARWGVARCDGPGFGGAVVYFRRLAEDGGITYR